MKIQEVVYPSCSFGMDETFFNNYKISMADGGTYSHFARTAMPETRIASGGAVPGINGGYNTPSALNGNRAIITNTDYLRDSVGGSLDLPNMSQSDIARAVSNIANNKGGVRVVMSEAQESSGPWANNTQKGRATKQFRWIEEEWAKYPNVINLGNYDGPVNVRPKNQDRTEMRRAMQTDEGMYNWMRARESEYHPFFSQKIYELHGPLIQGYGFGMLDDQERIADTAVALRMWAGVNRFLGYNPYRINFFGWGRVSEFQNYTAHTLQNIEGGTMEGHDFPFGSPAAFSAIARRAAWNGQHGVQWSETILSGTNPNLVPVEEIRSDGYKMIRINSTTAYQVPPQDGIRSYEITSPYKESRVYPRAWIPLGQADVTPCGYYLSGMCRQLINQRPQDVEFMFGGSYTAMTPDYLIDTMDFDRPWMEGAWAKNEGLVAIEDVKGKECVNGEGIARIKAPNGKPIEIQYKQGRTQLFHITDI